MKKTISYAMIFSAILMTGCEQKEYQTPTERGVSNSTQTVTTTAPNSQTYQASYETAEDKELKDIVAKMKAQDPSIIDAYYSVDESGQKILNLVKEEAGSVADAADKAVETATSGSGLSTFMWAMAGGLTANALFNAFSSNKGNMSALTNQYKPMGTQRGTYQAYQAQKHSAVTNYRSKFAPNNGFNSNRNALSPSVNTANRPTTPVTNTTTNKLTPVKPNAVTGAPLSKEAYRTQIVTKPKANTTTYQATKPTTKTSVFKRGGSIFKKRR